MKKHFGLAVLLMGAALLQAQENYTTNWTGHRTVGVNTGASGANVTATVLNFPVLVRLGAADSAVFLAAKGSGADLRFTKSNNTTRIPHQIEKWDSAGRSAAVWVLMDSVKASSVSTLRMHWGNAAAVDSSNGTAVFDSSKGFQAVWHMNGADSTANELDATVNAFTATAAGTPGTAAGIIAGGRNFGGGAGASTNEYFDVLNSGKSKMQFPARSHYTVSAWANAPSITQNHTIIAKNDKKFALQINATSNSTKWEGFEYNNNSSIVTPGPGTPANVWGWQGSMSLATATTGWHHLVTVHDSMSQTLYLDGILQTVNVGTDTLSYTSRGTTVSVDTTNYRIGKQPEGTANNARNWLGQLDEIRIANVKRDSNWVKLEYATQKATVTAVQEIVLPSNIYYVIPGAGNTPRDTVKLTSGIAANLPLNYTGGPVDSVVVTAGTLPAGLAVNKGTGALTGTATAASAEASYTITVYSLAGNVTRGLRLSVLLGAISNLHYASDTAVYAIGLPVSNTPSSSGHAATGYSVSPALPAGLTLDGVTGVISGAPTTVTAAATYTVKAKNATDSTTVDLRITVNGAETYSTWGQHKTIWLNTQTNGANIIGNVQKFPVLVRLDSASFNFTQAAGNGSDIRFTKADDATRLPHQIESWDSAGKKAAVWVLADTVKGGNGTQTIRLHWSKAGAANASNGPSVFDTANGFRGVWHMNGTAAASNEADATVNGFTATEFNDLTPVAGLIGGARTFGGTNDYFYVNGSQTGKLQFAQDANFTVSAWAYANTLVSHGTLVARHDRAWALKLANGGGSWEFFQYQDAAGWNAASTSSEATVWTHVVGVQNGASTTLYLNGVLFDSPVLTAGTNARLDTARVAFGRQSETSARYWNGLMDEIRINGVARSGDWVKLEYENQKAAQTLVSFTQPTSIDGSNFVARTQGYDVSAKALGQGMLFQIQSGRAAGIRLSLVDMSGRAVWSRTATVSGTAYIAWDGKAANGSLAPKGIYALRVTFLSAENKVLQTMDRKLPFTR